MGEPLSPELTRRRAAEVLGGSVACVPIRKFADADLPEEVAAAVFVTDELPMPQAVALYSEAKRQRARSGLSALVVSRAGCEQLEVITEPRAKLEARLSAYETATAEAVFAARLPAAGEDPAGRIDAALDELGRVAGCEPLSILHRIRFDDLAAVEEGEGDAFDPADLLPDDAGEAHARILAERAALRELAGRSSRPLLIQVQPVRSYDEATALAEMSGGPARVFLVASPPAKALLYLGFGAFNACPPPHEHARVWEHWGRAVGAEPVLLDGDRLSGVVALPVASRASLVRFAREVALYDEDTMQDGALTLAGRLYRNTSIEFWWD